MPTQAERERVLVLAPTAADAAISRSILGEARIDCALCADIGALVRDMQNGVGALLLTSEVLGATDLGALIGPLRAQPPWSDVPIVLLSPGRPGDGVAAAADEVFGTHVTLLERPVRVSTLVSTLQTAILARRRQYAMANQLTELLEAEVTLRRQGERLRLLWEAAAVLLVTEEPGAMMRSLFARIAGHLQLDAYFSYTTTDSGDALRLESSTGIPESELPALALLEIGAGPCGSVALTREPLVAASIQHSDDPGLQQLKSYGLRSYVCSPLLAEGRLLGTLAFASRNKDAFDVDELEFMRTICRYVTVAYERVRMIHQLRDADRRKDEFLAMLAHELRNPLAPIRNALQVIRMSPGDGAAVDDAHAIMTRQLGQMVRLIDDLLDVSRITRGKLELKREQVGLAELVRNAVDTAMPLIQASDHALEVTVPSQPIHVDGDPVRLAQVLANLLNNAAKYTEPGGRIALEAKLLGDHVEITVRDNGIGIPPDALRRVFEMFAQIDRSLEKAHGGLGIGLTLVKRLVEMHGGTVEALSDGPGRGARFVVRLPTAPGEADRPVASVPRRVAAAGRFRILVADDNADAADSMALMLRLMGNEVRTVSDGAQAVAVAEDFRPHVVLLDIGMPRMNGYDAARGIREQGWGKDMLLVALTGWGQEEDKRRASEVGFNRHFIKPVDPLEIERLVEALGDRPPRSVREAAG